MKRLLLIAALLAAAGVCGAAETGRKLRIGITLHPYYSFTAAIVGDLAEVVPLIDAGFNSHNYSPQPADIKRAMTLDALILNGVGHDPFAVKIVEAAGRLKDLPLINANENVSLLPVAGLEGDTKAVNPHTFISIATSIQQVNTIADGLAKLSPENAAAFRKNARAYAARLRRMKADAMKEIAALPKFDLRCASIHGSYDYILAEFGLEVSLVAEPAMGAQPSAAQMRHTIDAMRSRNIQVLFAEEEFPAAYVDTLREATGVKTRFLKHLTAGSYSVDYFEAGMKHNLDQIVGAIRDAQGGGNGT